MSRAALGLAARHDLSGDEPFIMKESGTGTEQLHKDLRVLDAVSGTLSTSCARMW